MFVHAGAMETFGLVSVEAQACGTRVLGVRGGGLEKTLKGEAPLIMAEEASAEAVEQVRAMDEEEAARMERSRRVRERFSFRFASFWVQSAILIWFRCFSSLAQGGCPSLVAHS